MSANRSTGRLLTSAAALGLALGVVEALAFLVLQRLDLLGWKIGRVSVWYEILTVAPIVDSLILTVAALGAVAASAAAARIGRRVRADVLAVAACSGLIWFDWLILPGRIRTYAAMLLSIGLASAVTRWHVGKPKRIASLTRRGTPWLGSIGAAVVVGAAVFPFGARAIATAHLGRAEAGSPNILIVVLDTVRADHTSLYGYARSTTPFLAQLSADGTVFENAYSTSSWTLPAHASLLTGQLPNVHGAVRNRLGPGTPMLTEVLVQRGYRTGAVSANLDSFTRRHGFGRGFIDFADFSETQGDMVGRTIYGRMFDEFVAGPLNLKPLVGRVTGQQVSQSALRWVDANGARAPFLLVLNYFDAHGPYEPPEPFRHQFSSQPSPGGLLRDNTLQQRSRLTPAQLQGEIDAYDGALVYLDRQLQVLFDGIRARGLLDNTIVIVLSDHGESFGEHGLFTHRTALYRELVRVPLVIRWPGTVPRDTRVAMPVSIADIPATIIDLLPRGAPWGLGGRSLASLWRNSAPDVERAYPIQELAQMPFKEFNWVPAFSGAMRAVTTVRWHYIEHDTLGAELYDLQQDPEELANQIATPEGAAVARNLSAYLRRAGSGPGR